jgi:mono/diheme cytochrome c family protein
MRKSRKFLGAGLVLALAVTAYAGGWAVLTVQNLPEYFVAGTPSSLVFKIRQHGRTLVDGVSPSISVSEKSGLTAKVVVSPTGNLGEYKAVFTLPQAGDWTIAASGLLLGDDLKLLPVRAVRAGETPPSLSAVSQGERLFLAKGCITCHANKDVAAAASVRSLEIGPDLTGRKYPASFLKDVLTDPQKALKKKPSETWEMPNLGLSQAEIDALSAFMNRERTAAKPVATR